VVPNAPPSPKLPPFEFQSLRGIGDFKFRCVIPQTGLSNMRDENDVLQWLRHRLPGRSFLPSNPRTLYGATKVLPSTLRISRTSERLALVSRNMGIYYSGHKLAPTSLDRLSPFKVSGDPRFLMTFATHSNAQYGGASCRPSTLGLLTLARLVRSFIVRCRAKFALSTSRCLVSAQLV